MRTNSSPPEPIDPLHLSANTNQAHLICRPTQATPTTIHHHCLAKSGLQMRRLQEGYDANGAVIARPLKDRVFTLRVPYCRGMLALNGAPKGAATITTDRASVEAFARYSTYLPHALDLGSSPLPAASATLPPEEARHSPRHRRGTTDKYLPAPGPTTTAAPNRSRRRGGEEEYQPTCRSIRRLAPAPASHGCHGHG
jgi:hypothetical protein